MAQELIDIDNELWRRLFLRLDRIQRTLGLSTGHVAEAPRSGDGDEGALPHPAELSPAEEGFYELARALWANHDTKNMDALSLIAAARVGLFGQEPLRRVADAQGGVAFLEAERQRLALEVRRLGDALRADGGERERRLAAHIACDDARERRIQWTEAENQRLRAELSALRESSLVQQLYREIEAIGPYLRGHAEEALDSTTRAALFWAAEHIESGDHLAQEAPPEKEEK